MHRATAKPKAIEAIFMIALMIATPALTLQTGIMNDHFHYVTGLHTVQRDDH